MHTNRSSTVSLSLKGQMSNAAEIPWNCLDLEHRTQYQPRDKKTPEFICPPENIDSTPTPTGMLNTPCDKTLTYRRKILPPRQTYQYPDKTNLSGHLSSPTACNIQNSLDHIQGPPSKHTAPLLYLISQRHIHPSTSRSSSAYTTLFVTQVKELISSPLISTSRTIQPVKTTLNTHEHG